jgi:hypothetical protein
VPGIADAVEQRVPLIVLFWGDATLRRGRPQARRRGRGPGRLGRGGRGGRRDRRGRRDRPGDRGRLPAPRQGLDLGPAAERGRGREPLPVLASGASPTAPGSPARCTWEHRASRSGPAWWPAARPGSTPPTSKCIGRERRQGHLPGELSTCRRRQAPRSAAQEGIRRLERRRSPRARPAARPGTAIGALRLARASGPGRLERSASACPTSTATPTTPRSGPASALTSSTTSSRRQRSA